MSSARLELVWGLSFAMGALAQLLARLSGLPGVVLLLLAGLLAGKAGLGWIQTERLGEGLGEGLEPVVGLLVSLILFHGGLNLRLAGRELQRSVVQLVVARLLLVLPMGAWFAHALAGLSWSLALVFSAIVLATGPTVVTPLVRQMRLEANSAQILVAEGLILEPLAAVLAVVLLELALGSTGDWREAGLRLLVRLGGGVVLGGTMGALLSELLRRLGERADPALQLQLCVGLLFLLFGGAETLLPESGLPAAVAAGVVVGLRLGPALEPLGALMEQLASLAITVLFPLLAADLSLQELSPLGIGGVACVLALMLWRAPVMQLAGLGLPSLGWRHRLIISWIAPRGIVSAAVASLFALRLQQAGVTGASTLKGLVFLTILLTVLVQGLTAPALAARLGLVVEEPLEGEGPSDSEVAPHAEDPVGASS